MAIVSLATRWLHVPNAGCVRVPHDDHVGDSLNVSLVRADSIPADVHQAFSE
jgi:hypothetical protein